MEIADSGHLQPLVRNVLERPLAATCGRSLVIDWSGHLQPLQRLRMAANGCGWLRLAAHCQKYMADLTSLKHVFAGRFLFLKFQVRYIGRDLSCLLPAPENQNLVANWQTKYGPCLPMRRNILRSSINDGSMIDNGSGIVWDFVFSVW